MDHRADPPDRGARLTGGVDPGGSPPPSPPIVVMGVAGSGKSTLGRALAVALGWRFVEGDDLHPPENVARMAAGIPLDDADRRPFLERVGAAVLHHQAGGVVAACSALKRSYRDLLRERAGRILFVLPELGPQQALARLERRKGHFMPSSLLASQFAALEPPGADEPAIRVDGAASVERQVAQVIEALCRME